MTTPTDPRTALHWQAFRYLHDEMTDAEVEAFESVLDHDQAAREMVAEVVTLAHAIRSTPPVSVSVALASTASNAGWASRAMWMSLGAAACLTLMVTWNAAVRATNRDSAHGERAEEPLAIAWSAYRNESPSDAEASASDDAASEKLADVENSDDEVIDTPDWLLSAVIEQQNPSQTENGVKQ